jgi:hypothetical protein
MTPEVLSAKKAQRFKFVKQLYNETEGNVNSLIDMWQLGQQLGFTSDETQNVADYLSGEGLIEFRAIGGIVGITHRGIQEVEEALDNPDRPTRHFGPVNILSVQNMYSSQIQQGSNHSSIAVAYTGSDLNDIAALISKLREALPSLPISDSERAEAESDASTLQAQLASPKPKSGVIRETLISLRHVLEHAAGHAAAVELLMRIGHVLGA